MTASAASRCKPLAALLESLEMIRIGAVGLDWFGMVTSMDKSGNQEPQLQPHNYHGYGGYGEGVVPAYSALHSYLCTTPLLQCCYSCYSAHYTLTIF